MRTCPQCRSPLHDDATSCPQCSRSDDDATVGISQILRSQEGPFDPSTGREAVAEILGSRYRISSKLGSGTFGEVYGALDTVLGRKVAIKRIRMETLADETQLDEIKTRFLREAQVAAQLSHPNIVTIHDIVSTETTSFIVMELIEGGTLQSLLKSKKRLDLYETIAVLAQTANALDHAHQHGVIHRDVKPANIMIESSGRVKVTDFGIAKAESSGNLTATGNILGTPNYMSPEQAQGKTLDGRSDLFSLGCIFYECLTGTKPFQGENVTSILMRIVSEDPPPMNPKKAGLPVGVEIVVRRVLAKDPYQRYSTGSAMFQALQSLPSADLDPSTMEVAATHGSPPPIAEARRGPSSTQPAEPLTMASSKDESPVTIRHGSSSPSSDKRGYRWIAGIATILVVLAVGLLWSARRPSRQMDTPSSSVLKESNRADATETTQGTTPQSEGDASVPAETETKRPEKAETAIQPSEKEPSPTKESPAAVSPESRSTHSERRQGPSASIESNEKAAIELLVRLARLQAEVKKEAGRFMTARQIARRRRSTNGMRLRGNQWVARGYRFVLETPELDFYSVVAIPIAYGQTGIRSFYIDAGGILRGADNEGNPAGHSDPALN